MSGPSISMHAVIPLTDGTACDQTCFFIAYCRRVWIRLARDLNDRCCYKFILQL